MWIWRRYEALEARLDSLRAERRPAAGAPPEMLARHAAEVEGLVLQVATLQVRSSSRIFTEVVLILTATSGMELAVDEVL